MRYCVTSHNQTKGQPCLKPYQKCTNATHMTRSTMWQGSHGGNEVRGTQQEHYRNLSVTDQRAVSRRAIPEWRRAYLQRRVCGCTGSRAWFSAHALPYQAAFWEIYTPALHCDTMASVYSCKHANITVIHTEQTTTQQKHTLEHAHSFGSIHTIYSTMRCFSLIMKLIRSIIRVV